MIYLLIGYMWLFIHRPFEIWPMLGTIRLERIYMIVTIIAWAMSGRIRWRLTSLGLAYLVFTASILFSFLLSPWSSVTSSQTVVENYLKILVFFVILVTSIRDERELKLLILGFLGVMTLYMGHSFREYLNGRHVYRMGVARMVGVDSSLGDPNSFSASVMYALPLAAVIPTVLIGRKGQLLWLVYVGLSVLCVLLTGSRSAFVGLLLWVANLGLKLKQKFRWMILATVLFPAIWSVLPPDLQNRFTTIIDPSVGPANAQSSAESREEGFRLGLELLGKYPLTGCGPGAWIPATGSAVESHNLYGQVMGELGILGVLNFGTIVVLLMSNVLAIRSASKSRASTASDFLHALAVAIGQAVLLLLLLGWGGHNLYRFNWLWYGAFLIVARDIVNRRVVAEGSPWNRSLAPSSGLRPVIASRTSW
jgi:hypothetical protein